MAKEKNSEIRVVIPAKVKELLKSRAKEEDCSMSWLVCDAIFPYLGVNPDELLEGKRPPKTKTERRKLWEEKQQKKHASLITFEADIFVKHRIPYDRSVTLNELEDSTGYKDRHLRTIVKQLKQEGSVTVQTKGRGGRLYIRRVVR